MRFVQSPTHQPFSASSWRYLLCAVCIATGCGDDATESPSTQTVDSDTVGVTEIASPPRSCADDNGGCEGTCTTTNGEALCSCENGYVLDDNGTSCNDINECKDSAFCVHGTCTNTQGGATCTDCQTGFQGDLCNRCTKGHFGDNCAACPKCVFGLCNDSESGDGTCTCDKHYTGPLCQHADPNDPPKTLRVRVFKDDSERTLVLERYSVRAFGQLRAKLVTINTTTSIEPEAVIRDYRGYCEEEPDATVTALLLPSGSLRYDVYKGNPQDDWGFIPKEELESAPPEITYSLLKGDPKARSGVPYDGATFTAGNSSGDPYRSVVYRAHMAFIVSKAYLDVFSDLSPLDVLRKAQNTLARNNAIMVRDLFTEVHVTDILLRKDINTVDDWALGRADLQAFFPDADPNSVFTVTDEFSSGLAFVCMNGSGNAAANVSANSTSKVGPNDDGAWYGVFRHEYGHTLGSGHYEGGAPEGPTIMSGNALSRFSGYELDAIINCRQTYEGNADRFKEELGVYTEYPIAPYARIDNKLALPKGSASLEIDVLANDHDANDDEIALASFETQTSLGGTVSFVPAPSPGQRDKLLYTPPEFAIQATNIKTCSVGYTVDLNDCESCVSYTPNESSSCGTSDDCSDDNVCVGGMCRVLTPCPKGAVVNACGQPCPNPDLLLWLDSANVENMEDSTGARGYALGHQKPIMKWFDQSGNGNDAQTYAEDREPELQLQGDLTFGKRPTLAFTEDLMEVRNIDVRPETHNELTSVAVAFHPSGDSGQVIWVQQQNGFEKRMHKAVGNIVGIPGVSTMQHSMSPLIEDHWINGTLSSHTEDKVIKPGGPTIALGALLFAGEGGGGAYHNALVLGEVLIFKRKLSDKERQALETYLLAKWGVKRIDQFWYGIVDKSGLMSRAPVHIELE